MNRHQAQRGTLSFFKTVWHDRRGATSIEYALIASLISIAILTGATIVSNRLANLYNDIASNIT